MQDIVLIHNTQPRVINLPPSAKTGYKQSLSPGTNEVPAKYWAECKESPSIQLWSLPKVGYLREVSTPIATEVQPLSPPQNEEKVVPPPAFLSGLSDEEALMHIHQCDEQDQLVTWGNNLDPGSQQNLVSAIVAKLQAMGVSP